jgi:tRNA-Thr(GGU) m(6)t(6)A37 methyltransferase TsaA
MTDLPVGSPGSELLLHPIGRVESPLTDPELAPKQGDEGAPDAWIVLEPGVSMAARDLEKGQDIVVLTWLHQADRAIQVVHPRSDPSRQLQGVFSTRSPDRPNPIGLHRVRLLAIDGNRLKVRHLEAIDGTPVLDIKPVLRGLAER